MKSRKKINQAGSVDRFHWMICQRYISKQNICLYHTNFASGALQTFFTYTSLLSLSLFFYPPPPPLSLSRSRSLSLSLSLSPSLSLSLSLSPSLSLPLTLSPAHPLCLSLFVISLPKETWQKMWAKSQGSILRSTSRERGQKYDKTGEERWREGGWKGRQNKEKRERAQVEKAEKRGIQKWKCARACVCICVRKCKAGGRREGRHSISLPFPLAPAEAALWVCASIKEFSTVTSLFLFLIDLFFSRA